MSFSIGEEVSLPQGHRAVLKWIGLIPGRGTTEYAGVEVLGPDSRSVGKHSGSFNGKSYFATSQPGTGLFISLTQLLSANAKTPRAASRHAAAGSASSAHHQLRPLTSPVPFAMPRFGDLGSPRTSRSGSLSSNGGETAAAAARELEQLRQQLQAERAKSEVQRNEFRASLASINAKVSTMSEEYQKQLADVRSSYEQKLRQARRSSALVMNSPENELDEQRQALAAMQNKLISERQQKQQQIDDLNRTVEKLQKAAGSAEELEGLAKELGNYEEALRAQSSESKSHKAEIERLEAALEAKLVRESELEQRIEELESRAKLHEKGPPRASTQQTPEASLSSKAHLEAHSQEVDTPEAQPNAATTHTEEDAHMDVDDIDSNVEDIVAEVPVPGSLSQFEGESTLDLAAGRTDWCGLCEREGHSATDCPYV